jgi:hypothetical protein
MSQIFEIMQSTLKLFNHEKSDKIGKYYELKRGSDLLYIGTKKEICNFK